MTHPPGGGTECPLSFADIYDTHNRWDYEKGMKAAWLKNEKWDILVHV